VDSLPLLINPKTGRVHTSYAQAVAVTGRLSSNNPNLQNIPIRTEKGREIRKAFIPRDENHVLVSADYSQIELRIVASISGDENMCHAFTTGKDIHTATAARVFNVPESEVTKEMRYKAKSVNFGIIYGQGAFGLSENLVDTLIIPDNNSGEFNPTNPYEIAFHIGSISNCSKINQAIKEAIIDAATLLTICLGVFSSGFLLVAILASIPAAPITITIQPPFKNNGINLFF
jgi:hypothetical protein